MSGVYIAHPTLAAPRVDDFGEHPRLLRALLTRGLVKALSADRASLLGGRLWDADDVGKRTDENWIEYVADKIAEYRDRAQELRSAIERCVTAEDYLRLVRDIDEVRQRLTERLGLRSVELSPVERELVASVASVSESLPGVPKVSGLWFGVRSIEKRYVFAGDPFQRFLYKEFVKAWKRASRYR
jgi:hypothetical protein